MPAEVDRERLAQRLCLVALAAAAGIVFIRMARELQGRQVQSGLLAVSWLLAGLLLVTLLGQYAKRRSPGYRSLLLAGQVLLTYVPVLIFDEIWLSVLGLLAGVVLVALPRPNGLVGAALVTATGPLAVFALPVSNRTALEVGVRTVVVGLVVYGVVRLSSVAAQAHALRWQSARLAVHRERVRIARDLHDLLGSALSAIATRSETAAREPDDPATNREHFLDIAELARRALGEVRDMVRDQVSLALAQELESARTALDTAAIRVRISREGPNLPPDLENCLSAVLREGVANVLRHSQARACSITVRCTDDTAELTVENDGVEPRGVSHGHGGLGNLAARVAVMGGALRASVCGAEGFRLRVVVPTNEARRGSH
ncbi:sensor histidine kinase [Streptomyces sp. T028]|uniref:sensor histidine kinase n=1 Tax=Streptomyces sp. T028 TaxID=3394379 RepID=UPI003A846CDF